MPLSVADAEALYAKAAADLAAAKTAEAAAVPVFTDVQTDMEAIAADVKSGNVLGLFSVVMDLRNRVIPEVIAEINTIKNTFGAK